MIVLAAFGGYAALVIIVKAWGQALGKYSTEPTFKEKKS